MSIQIPQHRVDPTGTHSLRENYASRLRGSFADLNTVIRTGVQQNDIFGLGRDLDTLQDDLEDPPVFPFATDSTKRREFMAWLSRQENRGILQTIQRDNNVFVKQAYSRGVQDADRAMNQLGLNVTEQELEAVFNTPIHQRSLQQLYTRNFENLEDITTEMNTQISEELTDGFSRGLGPDQMARNITDRVDKVGKHRATLLARTELVNAYSESTLNRYSEMGITNVTIRAEWLTAGDNRVCPICQSLEGNTWTIQEARTETFQFEPGEGDPASLAGEYPVKPPAHPSCRCRIIANIA